MKYIIISPIIPEGERDKSPLASKPKRINKFANTVSTALIKTKKRAWIVIF